MLIKTLSDRVDAVRARLAGIHPYELPEFVVLRASDVSPAYLNWVRGHVDAKD
jgi:periplasmic divalent cation tolerance protein